MDKVLSNPEIRAIGARGQQERYVRRKWTSAYSNRVAAATEMVAVFYENGKTRRCRVGGADIRVVGPSLGDWKTDEMWKSNGASRPERRTDFEGRLEPYVSMIGPSSPWPEDQGTTVTVENSWQFAGDGRFDRRGVVVPLAVCPQQSPGLA